MEASEDQQGEMQGYGEPGMDGSQAGEGAQETESEPPQDLDPQET